MKLYDLNLLCPIEAQRAEMTVDLKSGAVDSKSGTVDLKSGTAGDSDSQMVDLQGSEGNESEDSQAPDNEEVQGSRTSSPPGSGEFLKVKGRAVSATVVKANVNDWQLGVLDFTRPGLLEKVADKFKGRTVYTDHDTRVPNWCGVITGAKWNGETSPPGIDIEFLVDAVARPEIARGIMIDPPAIRSMSIGFRFAAEKSHPDLSDAEFMRLQGEERDGHIVRYVITEIVDVRENSLVNRGADPNAQIHSYTRLQAIDSQTKSTISKEDNMEGQEAQKTQASDPQATSETQASEMQATQQASIMDVTLQEAGKRYIESLKARIATLAETLDDKDLYVMTGDRMLATGKAEDIAQAEELISKLEAKRDAALPLVCAKCGSTKVERRTSRPVSGAASGQSFDPSTVEA